MQNQKGLETPRSQKFTDFNTPAENLEPEAKDADAAPAEEKALDVVEEALSPESKPNNVEEGEGKDATAEFKRDPDNIKVVNLDTQSPIKEKKNNEEGNGMKFDASLDDEVQDVTL
jgi:hypothetical protein